MDIIKNADKPPEKWGGAEIKIRVLWSIFAVGLFALFAIIRGSFAPFLLIAFALVVATLVVFGISFKEKERWVAVALCSILIVFFSLMAFIYIVIIVPIGLFLLGFSIWKLFTRKPVLK